MKTRTVQPCAILAATALAALSAAAVEVRMSPDGDDANDGSAAKPVKTLARAVALVRAAERDEDHFITVADGFYPFSKPVKLGERDYDLTIRAEHPGRAVFSGAEKVTGWRTDPEDKRFLVADMPFEVTAGMKPALIVNGTMCAIAAYPAKGTLKYKAPEGSSSILYDSGGADFSSIDLKSAWLVLPQEWSALSSAIAEHDADGKVFTLARGKVNKFNQGYRLMNTRHGLNAPGTWMFEATAGRVVYWPREGETAETLDASLARANGIIFAWRSRGIRLEGLVFEGCATRPECSNPYGDSRNAAIGIGSAEVTVDGCEVRLCAGTGIQATKPWRTRVLRSHVHHVGGACIDYFDGGYASDVEWCHLHHGGLVSRAALAHLQISNARFVGNKVHDGPANGVVMWTTYSVFASNEVSRVMYASRDGGGLYGGFKHCVLSDNYVHDIGAWPGLYVDEGSLDVVYRGNRFERCFWPVHAHQSQYIVVTNNVFVNDSPMRFSFQGSGHCVFADNRIYTGAPVKDDKYRDNCDFWGRNEVFVRQADGEYKPAGVVTLERRRRSPGTIEAPDVSSRRTPPLSPRGEIVFDAFDRKPVTTETGADGYPACGVPFAFVNVAHDEYYLYVSIRRKWNQFGPHAGWKNATTSGWGHSDCDRLDFEGGLYVLVHPTGRFECSRQLAMEQDDVKTAGSDNVMIRVPLAGLGVKGAQRALERLELDSEDDGLLLTEEAGDELKGSEKKLPKAMDVSGRSIKFNASVWIEDTRESKSLFPPDGGNFATGELKFGRRAEKGAEKKGKKKGRK